MHYRRWLLCRVSQTLPSAFYRALGKEAVCWVPERKHSANNWHSRQRGGLPSAEHSANNNTRQRGGLPSAKHSANQNTRQRDASVNGRQPPLILCRVSSPDTRQRGSFAECLLLTLGKEAPLPSVIVWHSVNHFFHFWPPNFFYSPHTIPGTPCFNVAHFSDFFLYFFNLFHLIEFSWIIQIITASHSNNEKKWME